MGVSGGGLGFDEGGVLQALSKPFWTRKQRECEYDKEGNLEFETIDEYNLSMVHVLVPLVFAGVITLTPLFVKRLQELWEDAGVTEGGAMTAALSTSIYGPVLGPIIWALYQAKGKEMWTWFGKGWQ